MGISGRSSQCVQSIILGQPSSTSVAHTLLALCNSGRSCIVIIVRLVVFAQESWAFVAQKLFVFLSRARVGDGPSGRGSSAVELYKAGQRGYQD